MQKYIDTQKIEHLDTIKTDEYKALVYCAYKGNQVTKRIKLMLEKYLEEMYKT
ncbi:MAG: hypothetical protein HN704_17480 [Bacteroidetes bacterium]|nr:hypothetical protein [Bacteroidota bacterium]MBT6685160.1 hypothetical protein [Bacteroidota bacterium]MBT7142071.1 hypothetical protein [Bacteroidota bacterium]MBT7493393.1 hypothetical protein [Bacteroidota bacterium]